VIGTFNVESPEPRAFGDSDQQFLEIFARDVAVALNTLEALAAAGDQRRPPVQSHVHGIPPSGSGRARSLASATGLRKRAALRAINGASRRRRAAIRGVR